MKLFLVRHGESENNLKGCWTGWQNVSLTDKGKNDAIRAKKYLEDISFDKVYCSDLDRTVQTAEIVLPDSEYKKTELLKEINVGILSGETFEWGRSKFGDALQENIKNSDYSSYGGESSAQFDARLKEFIKIALADREENIIAFTHAGVIRRIISKLIDVEFTAQRFICKNCAIAILEYAEGKWRLHSWINSI